MARPRGFYRGESSYGWIITLVVSVLAALALLGIWLFYDLQQYMVYDKDGAHLELPSAGGAAPRPDGAAGPSGAPVRELPRIDVEIVVDKADFSGVAGTDAAGLAPLRGRFVAAGNVTEQALNGYAAYGPGEAYDALVLELKPEGGELVWHSAVPLAESYGVNGTLELRECAARLKEQGVWLVAQLSALTDSTMAVRNAPAAMRSAVTDGVYIRDGRGWLDPYGAAREYLAALMEELRDMGFDEILFTGLWLPEDENLRYSGEMTATPDAESAVSSLALYLRDRADALGLRLSAVAESASLREGGHTGQDLEVFFKAFDRVAFAADAEYSVKLAVLEAVLRGNGNGGAARIVPVAEGYVPERESYIVK